MSLAITVTTPFKDENPRRCHVPSQETAVSATQFFWPKFSLAMLRNSSEALWHWIICTNLARWRNILLHLIKWFDLHRWWHIQKATKSFKSSVSSSYFSHCSYGTIVDFKWLVITPRGLVQTFNSVKGLIPIAYFWVAYKI